jgi:large subunit ribosomal protein L25
MSHTIELKAEPRAEVGKSQMKVLRRAGYVPGNVYGGPVSTAIKVESKALAEVLRHSTSTTLISLTVGDKAQPCLLRKVQYETLKPVAIHVDFYAISMDSSIKATIRIVLRGEAPAARGADAMLLHLMNQAHVEGRPGALPESIEVDISSLTEIDQAIFARDLKLPPGVALLDAPDQIVAKIQHVRGAAETEAPIVGSAAAAAARAPDAAAPAVG